MVSTHEHEHTLNVFMARLLSAGGLASKPEVARTVPAGGRARIDIEVRIGPARIAIEAEHGQSADKRRSAIADADKRINQEVVDCALAVCYPDSSNELNLPGAEFLWCVRDGSGSAPQWRIGNLERLISVVRLMPAQLGNPDFAAAALSASLDAAVERLSTRQKRSLAVGMNLPPGVKGKQKSDDWDKPAKRALLVVATAVMFHARLDPHMESVKPDTDARHDKRTPFKGAWPPSPAADCVDSSDPIQALKDAWDQILALDYKPIFQTGRFTLAIGEADPGFVDAVRITSRAALSVVRNIAGIRHDLLGRIFHTVLDSARYDGSFYTTTAAATLLATLALSDDQRDWASLKDISNFRVTDPACGTGTLLMAAAERIRELSSARSNLGALERELDKTLIEDVLSGFDVNLTATHMAATTLGLLSPTTQFQDMKIGMTFLGVDEARTPYLGSLEFLESQPKLVPWPSSVSQTRHVGTGHEIARVDPSDVVIMNPPFTRDSLRHDQFNEVDEGLLKGREKDLFENGPVHRSGNSGSFLVLADHLIKEGHGTVAAILPMVTATNASSLPIRKFVASKFHVETLVTSHDPKRANFSENTKIGEILLVGRRWSGESDKPPTRIVNLAINPATPSEAVSLAHDINQNGLTLGDFASVQEWSSERVRSGDWGGVQFLAPFLCEKFAELTEGSIFDSVSLKRVASVGPAGQGVREVFDKSAMPTRNAMKAIWYHKTDVVSSMQADTDTNIRPKPTQGDRASKYWGMRGRLMLPTRVRLNTVRMLAVRLTEPALGSGWVPCRVKASEEIDAHDAEKVLCVYLNSSLGILATLGNRSARVPAYSQLSMDDLKRLVVPNIASLSPRAAREVAGCFDQLAESRMMTIASAPNCETRHALDRSVAAAFDIDEGLIADVRKELAAEPSMTGKRYCPQSR